MNYMAKVHTKQGNVEGVIEFEILEPSYKISEEGKEGLGQHRIRGGLLHNLIKVLDGQGERFFHSGVARVDAYQKNGDGLRMDYWCDASGRGKIELGLQAPIGQKGYSPVLVFTFKFDNYIPQPWSETLFERIATNTHVEHYLPGSLEKTLEQRAVA